MNMFWLFLNQPQEEAEPVAAKPKKSLRHSRSNSDSIPTPATIPAIAAPTESSSLWEDYSDQVLCMITPDSGCFYVSSNIKSMTGHSIKSCEGDGILSLIHADYRKKLIGKMAELAGKPEVKHDHFKCQMRHADGKYVWYEFTVAARREEEQLTFICFLRNIQDEMINSKRLQKAKLEAELALKGRSEFLANMSHELRTPLNAIIGFAQMMDNQIFGKIDNPRYQEYITNIHDSGHALLSKINDLLEVSNLEAGRVTLSVEHVDLIGILRHAIEIQSHHAFATQITIRENFFKYPVLLKADRVKLTQALSNILSNAIKYNVQGGEVHISTAFADDGNLAITIADSGNGMASKDVKTIMASFGQESNLFTRSRSIIGLGLALAREFVGLHEGHLSIESKEGKGTSVTITLPRERIIAQPTRSRARPKARASA